MREPMISISGIAFANMLRYIARLYDTEVEGTSCGTDFWSMLPYLAMRIVLVGSVNLRQISLKTRPMNTYLQYNLLILFSTSSHSFSNYITLPRRPVISLFHRAAEQEVLLWWRRRGGGAFDKKLAKALVKVIFLQYVV